MDRTQPVKLCPLAEDLSFTMFLLDESDPEVAALLLFLAGRTDGGGDLGMGGREPHDQRIECGAVVGRLCGVGHVAGRPNAGDSGSWVAAQHVTRKRAERGALS